MRDPSRDILGTGGPIARLLGPDFEPRPQQTDMAAAVMRAMSLKQTAVIEAGTGVGKSFAYLVPAMLRCLTTDERVVVATNTIALQEQLIGKDIPLLRESMQAAGEGAHAREDGGSTDSGPRTQDSGPLSHPWGIDRATARPLTAALVKGRGNYVSIRRLKLASTRQDRLFADAASRNSLHIVEDWAYETTDGSLASLPPLERPGIWDRVQSDSDNCMGRKCPTYEQCFYQRSRRAMEAANLLICNHAVFFSDLALRAAGVKGFLPDYQHVILDEAHGIEDAACDHFGLAISEGRVEHFLGALYHKRSGKGYLPHLASLGGLGGRVELADAAMHAVLGALDASRGFFDDVSHLARSGRLRSGRITQTGLLADALSPAMKGLALRLKQLKEETKSEPDKFELNAYAVRADAIAFDVDVLVNQKREGYVYWLEGGGGGGAALFGADANSPGTEADPDTHTGTRGTMGGPGGAGVTGIATLPRPFKGATRMKLACSPIEVGPMLREHLFSKELGIVLTSATLATAGGLRAAGRGPRQDGEDTARANRQEPRGGDTDSEPSTQHSGHRPSAPGPAPSALPFDHLRSRLHFTPGECLALGSPFDHARQAELVIDLSVPDPRGGGGSGHGSSRLQSAGVDYHGLLARRVLHHIRHSHGGAGGAFVLCTSFATIRALALAIEPDLQDDGLPLLVQGRDGPPAMLLERFRKDERSVLLGAASFWQGVDVKGRGLRTVIITKLPFDPPDRPIVEARCERIKAKGGDPFKEESLPRAILKFRQGFGRLIRSATDFGRVIVLDPRLATKSYGRQFVQALPEGVRVRTISLDEPHAHAWGHEP